MRVLAYAVAALLLTAGSPWAATGDPATAPLIKKLVEKGMLSEEDAREVAADLEDEQTGSPEQQAQEVSKPSKKGPNAGPSFEIKLRAQARFDAGDLLVGPEGGYETEKDLHFRRVRLELDKEFEKPPIGKKLDLNLTLEADRAGQDFRNGRRRNSGDGVALQYLYADWIFADPLSIKIGKHKLPFLRVELTSSARQLLIERPAVTGAAKDILGDYHQPQLQAHGQVAGGAARYYLSYADGAADLDEVQGLDDAAEELRHDLGKAFIGRIEIAPLAFAQGRRLVEKKRDDTGIGAENHLTLAVNGGFQRGIKYQTASVADARLDTRVVGVDLAGRYSFGTRGTLTGQLEYLNFLRDFNYQQDERPQGGYFQAGYLLPFTWLSGRLEPALRYEVFDHDRVENPAASGSRERTVSVGVNHYLLEHSLKWSYNFVHTRFDRGVAEAAGSAERYLHQLQLQLYF